MGWDGAFGASTVFWLAIVCFVLIGSYFRYRTRESEHRLLEKLAEKGQAISPEILANLSRNGNGGSLTGAVVLMFIGVGLVIFFWAMTGGGGLFHGEGAPNWLPVIGIIPFTIGLGLFIGRLIERRRNK